MLIHIRLKAPVLVGKRKTEDIQFYREASDVQFDETGNRKRRYRAGDEDEIELEQEERRHRHQLNKEFKSFANRIADAVSGSWLWNTDCRSLMALCSWTFRTATWASAVCRRGRMCCCSPRLTASCI